MLVSTGLAIASFVGGILGNSSRKREARRAEREAKELARQKFELSVALGSKSLDLADQDYNNQTRLINMSAAASAAAIGVQKEMLIAEVQTDNKKVEDLKRSEATMVTKTKADMLVRSQDFNRQMALAMVKGAASGRTLGEGSMQVGFNKAYSDRAWESMWNNNILDQNVASFARDRMSVLESGYNKLKYGFKSLAVQSMANRVKTQTSLFQANSSRDHALYNAYSQMELGRLGELSANNSATHAANVANTNANMNMINTGISATNSIFGSYNGGK